MTGQDESTVRRQIRAVKSLELAEINALRNSPKWIGYKDIAEIGKITEADEREFVVKSIVSGEAKTISVARKAYRAARGEAPAPASPKDATLARLLDAWDRAGKGARMAFLEERAADVAALFDELEQGGAA